MLERLVVKAREGGATHCPYCRDVIHLEHELWRDCSNCQARQHRECWYEARHACVTCGISAARPRISQSAADEVLPVIAQFVWIGLVTILIVAGLFSPVVLIASQLR